MAHPTSPAARIVVREARDVVDAINSGLVRGGNEKAIVLIALGGIFIDAYDFTSIAFETQHPVVRVNPRPVSGHWCWATSSRGSSA